MALERTLIQDELDSELHNPADREASDRAASYDFRRPDRIAKDQLRSIHLLHDNFTRSLASSLSAYLRAYVMVNLVSVEQLSFAEFTQCLPSPTCIVTLGMKPFDNNAVLEVNPSLSFPILEILLGGNGKNPARLSRETTEIERSILEGFYRIILQDLKEAWSAVSQINFSVEGHETEPQLLQILAPNEAVVAVGIEVRIGDSVGMINLGIPSISVKMLRQRFDQQWSMRRSESTEQDQERVLRLIKPAPVQVEARLEGPKLTVDDVLQLQVGDVLQFDHPVHKPVKLLLNGTRKLNGHVVATGSNLGLEVADWEG